MEKQKLVSKKNLSLIKLGQSLKSLKKNEIVRYEANLPKIRNSKEAWESESMQLSKLDESEAIEMIKETTLFCIADSFNVRNTLTEGQYGKVAENVLNEFKDLKLSELETVFHNATMGRYGQIYERIDVNVVMNWVRLYYEDRSEHFAIMRENENSSSKHDGAVVELDDNLQPVEKKGKVPQSFIDGRKRLEEKLKDKKRYKTKIPYQSFPDYCARKGIDFKEYMDNMQNDIEERYKDSDTMESFEIFLEAEQIQILFNLNK